MLHKIQGLWIHMPSNLKNIQKCRWCWQCYLFMIDVINIMRQPHEICMMHYFTVRSCEMAAILQTTLSITVISRNMLQFQDWNLTKFQSLFPRVQSPVNYHWFRNTNLIDERIGDKPFLNKWWPCLVTQIYIYIYIHVYISRSKWVLHHTTSFTMIVNGD